MLLGAAAAIALGALAPGPGLAADEPIRACTLIGCTTGVAVETRRLPKVAGNASRVTVCALGQCVTRPSSQPGLYLITNTGSDAPRPIRVTVVLRNGAGTRVWRRERTVLPAAHYPNGRDCPPACWNVRLAVDGAYLRVVSRG